MKTEVVDSNLALHNAGSRHKIFDQPERASNNM